MRKNIQMRLYCLSSVFRQHPSAGPPGASQRNGEAKQRPQPGEGTPVAVERVKFMSKRNIFDEDPHPKFLTMNSMDGT